jgi:biopolymer transport protein ExbD
MAELNIIPLVDVILVLLIIFMATTAFVKETGLNLQLPSAKATGAAKQSARDLTIVLSRDGELFLDNQPISEAQLAATLRARVKENPQTHVVIKGDASIAYERVVRVMDMAREAGLSSVALGTRLLEEKAATTR